MALSAAEQKEIRAMILGMIDRGCVETQMERAWKLAADQYSKLKAATVKAPASGK